MTDTFLEKIFKQYNGQDLSRHCFVFPTRRGAYVFRQLFLAQTGKTVWLPEMLAIRDLVERLSPWPVADDLELLLILHEVVSEFEKDIPIDKFFPWGKILLNDFNEIDLNLVDAARLYEQVYEEREIDTLFSLPEEDLEDIAGFWKLFSKKPLTSLQESFLANWKSLPDIYKKFKQKLTDRQIAYEGMAYRSIVDQLKDNKLFFPWDKLVIAGFYALSAAEKVIFEILNKQKKAELLWDVDEYYFSNPSHEAGLYLRRNEMLKTEFKWKQNYFKEIKKEIYITGAPLQTAQVKWLSELLKKKLADPEFNPQRSVIVLPDETMLLSLLNSLPEELSNINITMGYPAKHSHAGNFIKAFLQLHAAVKFENGKAYFTRNELESFTSVIDTGGKQYPDLVKFLDSLSQNYVSTAAVIERAGKAAFLFEPLNDFQSIQLIVPRIFNFYNNHLSQRNTLYNVISEYLQDHFTRLFDSIEKHAEKFTPKILFQILEEELKTVKIPFTGEPMKGIQVMGFLETRTLDFENVFILSVNENFLPASSSGKTYIPYSIRKFFKLPLRVEQDAVYGYHFYRLLQRTSEVHLIYNTEAKSFSSGDMSRYLLQIAFELTPEKGYPVNLHFSQVSTEAILHPEIPITIAKDDVVIKRLQDLYLKTDNARGMSASAIGDYVTCTMRFYFKYVAGIKKPNEPETEIDSKIFGNIFHTAISSLYKDKKELKKEDFAAIKKQVKIMLDEAISKEYKKNVTGGNDWLLKEVLSDLLTKIIDTDAAEPSLEIVGLEQEYSGTINVPNQGDIALYGKIDRVDRQKEIVRIIDYKTGKDEISEKIDIEAFFTNPDKKVMLQLLFYALLYRKNFPGAPIKAGMYQLRSVNSGVKWFDKGTILSDQLLNAFSERLEQLLSGMFDKEIPFIQTDDKKRCVFCEFNVMCYRL